MLNLNVYITLYIVDSTIMFTLRTHRTELSSVDWPAPDSVTESEEDFDRMVKNEDVRCLLKTISPETSKASQLRRLRHLTRINIHLADPNVRAMRSH